MLLKTRMEQHIAVRTIFALILLAILDILLITPKWYVLVGLATGWMLTLLRLGTTARMIARLIGHEKSDMPAASGWVFYVLVQVVTLTLLVIAAIKAVPLFFGMIVGVLLVPAVIMLNTVTEAMGITHDNFFDK